MSSQVINADVLDGLRGMASDSVDCVCTSPPYFGLRSYLGLPPTRWSDGSTCCLGSESTPGEFVAHIVEVFGEVRRVLKPSGVCWVNVGDSYSADSKWGGETGGKHAYLDDDNRKRVGREKRTTGLDNGNLLGIPWRCALALQADGWTLRSEMIWKKDSAMPQSVQGWRWERCRVKTSNGLVSRRGKVAPRSWSDFAPSDYSKPTALAQWQPCSGCERCRANDGFVLRKGSWRPTTSHEQVFLLVKSGSYFCDRDAVATPLAEATASRERYTRNNGKREQFAVAHDHESDSSPAGANMRTVQSVPRRGPKYEFCYACHRLYIGPEVTKGMTKRPCRECGGKEWVSHYASFSLSLPLTLIKASCSEAGNCAACGSPWARVVKTEYAEKRPSSSSYAAKAHIRPQVGLLANRWDTPDKCTTIGFRPTCTCSIYRLELSGKQFQQLPEHLKSYFEKVRPESAKPLVLDPFSSARGHP